MAGTSLCPLGGAPLRIIGDITATDLILKIIEPVNSQISQ